MKKTVFLILISMGVLLCLENAEAANDIGRSSIAPDPDVVAKRIHTKKLKDIHKNSSKEEQLKKTNEYLGILKTKELLEFVSELTTEKDFGLSVVIAVPHLKRNLSEHFPVSEFCSQIKDKKHNPKYRAFLIDIATKFQKKNLQQTKNAVTDTSNSLEICETLISTAEDEDNEIGLRRYALLQLGRKNSNLYLLKKQKSTSFKADVWDTRLLKLYKNDKSPKIKGAAITAMRRSQSSGLENILTEVLDNPENHDDIIVKHAIVSLAKSGFGGQYVDALRRITNNPKNDDIYQTTIYALGIIGDVEAICTIAEAYHKFGFARTIRSAFRKNENTIFSMLASSKDDHIVSCGILAVKIGRIATAKQLLESIITTHKNMSLRQDAQEALNEINIH